jgi:Ca-activated chloride channel family protein
MFTFQWPWFILVLPLPWLIRLLVPAKTTSPSDTTPQIRFPHMSALQASFAAGKSMQAPPRKGWLWILFTIWSLFVLALMRPQVIDQIQPTRTRGRDLMLAVDLSGSMQSLDFSNGDERASRLDVAKKVVKDFVNKRAGDRVGLIVFGEHAYLSTPLTLDRSALTQMLDNTRSGLAGDATAIGDALGLAVKNLRERPADSRAIILLTDGEDNSSTLPPLQAAKIAKQYGIRIYTIVIGKDGLVPFPDGQGGYAMVESHVDTELTQQISKITGGEFYRATSPESLVRIYDHIDSLQKTESDPQPILIRKHLYQYPLVLALLLLGTVAVTAQWKGAPYEFV